MHISADNRYLLYVNEKLVSLCPAMGDIRNWNYETVDIAPYLKNGENIVAAKVWNKGNLKSLSKISLRTGFILQGTDEKSQVLNTGDSLKCVQDFSYTAIPVSVRRYYAAGAAEIIDMNHKVKGWRTARLCAVDTYMDCPYYERLQYIGDSRRELYTA